MSPPAMLAPDARLARVRILALILALRDDALERGIIDQAAVPSSLVKAVRQVLAEAGGDPALAEDLLIAIGPRLGDAAFAKGMGAFVQTLADNIGRSEAVNPLHGMTVELGRRAKAIIQDEARSARLRGADQRGGGIPPPRCDAAPAFGQEAVDALASATGTPHSAADPPPRSLALVLEEAIGNVHGELMRQRQDQGLAWTSFMELALNDFYRGLRRVERSPGQGAARDVTPRGPVFVSIRDELLRLGVPPGSFSDDDLRRQMMGLVANQGHKVNQSQMGITIT